MVVLLPLVALFSLGRTVADWAQVVQVAGSAAEAPARSFDGVVWEEDEDGVITAAYVFPQSPAARAGLRAGDVFYMLSYQQYFNVEDVQAAVGSIPPGNTRAYYVRRGEQFAEARVTFTRYPPFLYPLSNALWTFSLWGFAVSAFFHVLGLVIVGPLARRSKRARFSLVLIGASACWVVGTFLRLMLVELLGPPPVMGTYAGLSRALTLVGLVGWVSFPALLVHKVLVDTHRAIGVGPWRLTFLVYAPAVVLGIAALAATLRGALGPLTASSLVAPILFYACCYIAAAAGLVLAFYLLGIDRTARVPGAWNRAGSAVLFFGALFMALSVLGVVPLFGAVTDAGAGWLVVGAQLISVVPVALVVHATLRHGKLGQVLTRALTYVTVLGLIFFAFVGGLSVIDLYLAQETVSRNVVSGLYVIVLLFVFERLARRMRVYAEHVFATDRQRAQQMLSRFQEQMRTIMTCDALARQTAEAVGEAFDVKTARLFLRPPGRPEAWASASFRPQPPYLTERALERVWPFFQREGRIWADHADLNESALPEPRARHLRERGAALALPIMGDGQPIGLLILGPKRGRHAVYNLADLDLLRSLSGQLALAVERLGLVARERALVKESAEAELVALRAQINPHFLFNALNTIIALIAERPEEAEETVEHLAAIFRHTLQAGSQPFVTLGEEFALAGHYLRIEEARFGEKLRVEEALPPELRAHPVPAFAVQTLVENAVKHGIAAARAGGVVRLEARRLENDAVEILVEDTGVGIPALFGQGETAAPGSFFGIGLRNVAARMERLYERPGLLRLRSSPEGTAARLILPEPAQPVPEETASLFAAPHGV